MNTVDRRPLTPTPRGAVPHTQAMSDVRESRALVPGGAVLKNTFVGVWSGLSPVALVPVCLSGDVPRGIISEPGLVEVELNSRAITGLRSPPWS